MDFKELKEFLETHDDYLILTHRNPDGDTMGSGFALWNILKGMGKRARVVNNEPFSPRYDFLYEGYTETEFEPRTVIAVDVADKKLLGENLTEYEDRVDVCIDHHISNKAYAKQSIVDGNASSATLVLYRFIKEQGIPLNDIIAKCIYTGLATDTGCFKFSNTIPEAHIAAAELMAYDIDFVNVNRRMFDIKSKGRMIVESAVTNEMEHYFGGKCTMICVTRALIEKTGVDIAEFDGLASIPLQVQGAVIGVTLREHRDREGFKLSVRTTEEADASAFCRQFGGGGHIRAAGCEIEGGLEEVKAKVLKAVGEMLGE
ncbi:MAG: bifunctional oligoribonuclease/PAP phosphatase NrnA [Ruminococcus sp.]|nr:bifunctional oligoribonuclease/PAP phosphatase NrnA [Ruminococcus sp.]MCR5140920.1 bifunctional oligoribonuclease/PAP phosphatase NrnA [Ruminococcus sp.]